MVFEGTQAPCVSSPQTASILIKSNFLFQQQLPLGYWFLHSKTLYLSSVTDFGIQHGAAFLRCLDPPGFLNWSCQLQYLAGLAVNNQLLMASQPKEGYSQGSPSSCQNYSFLGSSLSLPRLAPTANFHFQLLGMEMCIWMHWQAPGLGFPTGAWAASLLWPTDSDVHLPLGIVCEHQAPFG